MAYTVQFTSAQTRLVDTIFGAQTYQVKDRSMFYTIEVEGKDLSTWMNKIDALCNDPAYDQGDIGDLYMTFSDAFNRWEDDKGCI